VAEYASLHTVIRSYKHTRVKGRLPRWMGRWDMMSPGAREEDSAWSNTFARDPHRAEIEW
jgi:hypothetical protein